MQTSKETLEQVVNESHRGLFDIERRIEGLNKLIKIFMNESYNVSFNKDFDFAIDPVDYNDDVNAILEHITFALDSINKNVDEHYTKLVELR